MLVVLLQLLAAKCHHHDHSRGRCLRQSSRRRRSSDIRRAGTAASYPILEKTAYTDAADGTAKP